MSNVHARNFHPRRNQRIIIKFIIVKFRLQQLFSGVFQKVNYGFKAINMTIKFWVFQNQKLQWIWKVQLPLVKKFTWTSSGFRWVQMSQKMNWIVKWVLETVKFELVILSYLSCISILLFEVFLQELRLNYGSPWMTTKEKYGIPKTHIIL